MTGMVGVCQRGQWSPTPALETTLVTGFSLSVILTLSHGDPRSYLTVDEIVDFKK